MRSLLGTLAVALWAVPALAESDPPPVVTPDPPPVAVAKTWRVPAFPGVDFTEAQLRAMYPGIRFDRPATPEVVGTDPFAGCGPAGCGTTAPTPAPTAVTPATPLTYGLGPSRAGTSTGATGAARSGGTSGCATGNCSAPTRVFRR